MCGGGRCASRPHTIAAAPLAPRPPPADPDSYLDKVNEREHFPKIEPSHFAEIHGIEPFGACARRAQRAAQRPLWSPLPSWRGAPRPRRCTGAYLPPPAAPTPTPPPAPSERADLRAWDLHTYPTDDWYERAKKATDRCDLELTQQWTGAKNGLADKVVWVTGLFDLKRGESGNKEFQRGMDEYFRRFQNVIDCGFEMVIFMPLSFKQHLRIDDKKHFIIDLNGGWRSCGCGGCDAPPTSASARAPLTSAPHPFAFHRAATDLHTYFPYYDRLTAIRTSKLWSAQGDIAGWLANSPQARLAEYNPLVMSKLIMLQQAARTNPFGSRYHLWMDAGHLCAGGQRPEGTSMYRRHMSTGLLMTHWPYATDTEVHGFADKAMHIYMAQQDEPLQIVRGGIFGGQLPHIECVLKAYIIALHQTMMDGYVGTEECIWAILFRRLPHLFAPFDNNSMGSHGDNCASFSANNMEEEAIRSGSKTKFVSPPVPEHPSWWDAAQAAGGKPGGAAAAAGGKGPGRAISGLMRVGGISTAGGKTLRA